MKKIYALAAVAFMAVSANAQLYVCGDGDGLGWDPANPLAVEKTGENYTFDVANLRGLKISTQMGDWDAFNAGVYGCNYGKEQGVVVPLEAGYSANISAPWKGDYTITVAGDFSTIVLSTETPEPADMTVYLYIKGGMNGWAANDDWKLEQLDEKNYKFVCGDATTIPAGEQFKIAADNWDDMNIGKGASGQLTEIFNETPELVDSFTTEGGPGNLALVEDCTGVLWLGLGYVEEVEGDDGVVEEVINYLEVSNDPSYVPDWYEAAGVANVAVDENAPAVYYNLQGVRVNSIENGLYIVVKGGKTQKVLVK